MDESKLDLLIKIMKMTAAEEAVALVALRKANALLKAEDWDWEKLLRGKVKVFADPFGAAPTPPPVNRAPPPPPPTPPRQPPPRPYAPPPPPFRAPPPPKQPTQPHQLKPVSVANGYDGVCGSPYKGQYSNGNLICDAVAPAGKSWAVKFPPQSKWHKYCVGCHNELMKAHGFSIRGAPAAAAPKAPNKWQQKNNPKSLDDLPF